MKKTLDVSKTFKKKALRFSTEKLRQILTERGDITLYLDKESHWNNGESEMVFTMHIKNNFE